MGRLNEQIKKIMGIMNIVENKQTYKYGCAMLYFDPNTTKEITSMIDTEDLYTEGDGSFGIEDEPHCTLLYGLHPEVSTEDVENVLNKYTYTTCKCYNPSCFYNEKYDVLKFDISGDMLSETNRDLTEFPHTTDYPDYHPHMTLAYLKPGKGDKYIKKIEEFQKEGFLHPQYAIYSKPNGEKDEISIRLD